MWLPGTAAAMPAIIASRVVSISRWHGRRRHADEERPGRIAVPAIDDGAGVDRHDLAVADRPLAGDAVDDLVIERDAQAGRERPARVDARVALERRDGAGRADVRLGQAVEVAGRDARLELALDECEDLGHDPPGATHPGDLGAGLAGDHDQLPGSRPSDDGQDVAWRRRRSARVPSTSRRMPVRW